jgi:alpha-1,6-mannosyltransferase
MPYDATYHLLWRPDKIRAVVRDEHPQVVEIHSPYVAAIGGLVLQPGTYGVRTFVWHSDFIDTYERVLVGPRPYLEPVARAAAGPLWAWVRRIAHACVATFCGSAWQARKLAQHGIDATHLPFGIDKDVFYPRDTPRRRGGPVTLMAAGRLAVEKRWDVVIEAFARVVAQRPDARLLVYGDGPERARLEQRAAAISGAPVRFMGFERDREKLALALSSADALVHACPYETFGIAIAEAIACGLPVVVPNEGGAAELACAPSGQSELAETYPTGDVEACAAAIDRLLSRDAVALRVGAIDAARSILSTREHFERLLAHYERLLLLHA